MPTFDSVAPGLPCWLELGTTDQNKAKTFYGSLFNWSSKDDPIGPSDVYTTFQIDGRAVGAAFTLTDELKQRGVSPHWMVYFASISADKTAAKAEELGAKIVVAPFDVMEHGRMAIIQDPGGAMFSVWQPNKHNGLGLIYEPNTLCWSELNSRDPAASKGFYTALFGWEAYFGTEGPGVDYVHLRSGGRDFGGMLQIAAEWGNIPPHWMLYFRVNDCDTTASKLKELGGKVHHGPFDAPKVGRMAIVADPQGAVFSIIQLDPSIVK